MMYNVRTMSGAGGTNGHGDESGMISKLVGMGTTWNGRLGGSNETYTYDELALFFLCINTGSSAFVKLSCSIHESALEI
jgi:hypothetical protein